jgi:hypothetical protein
MRRPSFSRAAAGLTLLAAVAAAGCDSFKPTEVRNPNLTDQQFLGTPGAGAAWLRGTQRQFLLTLNTVVLNSEIGSDNYFNNYTTNNQQLDAPNILYIDPEVTSIQNSIARLRYMASFGLDSVFPKDPLVTANDRAQLTFLRGTAQLFAGETYVGLPAVPNGPVVEWGAHLTAAVADFTQARTLSTDATLRQAATLLLARAYHRLGNKAKATEEAAAALAASPTLLYNATFDGVNGPNNGMVGVLTSNVNNLQPLPRLDFLDPKHPNRGANIQTSLAFAKAEEAHLILAEAAVSDNNLAGARDRLKALLALVATRPVETVDNRVQQRGRAGGKVIYPNSAAHTVAFAPGQPQLAGYVLDRNATTRVPTVSGTSVTTAGIDAAATADDLLYLVYLMRQEIFIAEGRRLADLGIRLPVAWTEIIANPNTKDGEPYTQAQVPAFIPRAFEMDGFTYDVAARTAVMRHDMNRVLVQNKASAAVLPFH